MANTIGNKIKFTLFGESHGSHIGFVLEGLKAGIKIDEAYINSLLAKRRPQDETETKRIEEDHYTFISGVFNGYTNGNPITVIIENKNMQSHDYEKTSKVPRPSHADYVSHVKYNGFEDYRGGGHFSGRITCAIVLCAGIIMPLLKERGINIATHIKELGGITDVDFVEDFNLSYLDKLENKTFPVVKDLEGQMKEKIKQVASSLDSIGGVCQTVITNLPVGLGEPWFDSLESNIAKAIFGIGGVKGIEFGKGFAFKDLLGSQASDEYEVINQVVTTKSNHNGGINGGIANGMPVVFNTAIKPTPSIYQELSSFNLDTLEPTTLKIQGRHDPAIIRRIAIVLTSITSIVIYDFLESFK